MYPKSDRHWLVYRQSIATEMRQGAAAKAISEYLEALGYQQTKSSPSLIFERGRVLAGLYNPNPRSQKTIMTVDFVRSGDEALLEVALRVNCLGNLPLQADKDFWQAELDGLAHTVHYGYCDPRLSYFAAERAKWYSLAIAAAVMIVILLLLLLMMMAMLGTAM